MILSYFDYLRYITKVHSFKNSLFCCKPVATAKINLKKIQLKLETIVLRPSGLVDAAGGGSFSFDLGPQPAQLHIVVVHQQATFNQSPGFAELLRPVMLQRPPQEALSQTLPPQTCVYAP